MVLKTTKHCRNVDIRFRICRVTDSNRNGQGLLYKLRMFGVPINNEATVFCDNESVVKSSTFPESTLKKKHVSIAFHRIDSYLL